MSRGPFALLRDYLPRVRHVLRTEGPRALVFKLRRRLGAVALRVRTRPRLVERRASPAGLVFPSTDRPEVSVVIPVFNNRAFTLDCLTALAAAGWRRPFEIVVVDDGSSDGTPELMAENPAIRLVRNPENAGFVASCNRGAAAARGRFLVFLNNDTQVQPGWLDALIDTFAARPDAGAVGARLVYPDGRLQEAGGILFEDGSAWNYGHLDDPYKPGYGYLREADYCSGAALAVPKDLFERLGGFDPAFSPGYYEDADLAMRVWAAGRRVYYCPQATVVHFEGATAGTDRVAPPELGMKRFQARNRETLVARWGSVLAGYGRREDGPQPALERRVRRRVLVADNYMLTPDRDSGSLRMANLFVLLRELGFQVTFAAANLEAPEPYVSRFQGEGIECLYRPYVRSVRRHLAHCGQRYELVILSRADTAAALMPHARKYCRNARILFDTVDLHFLRERRLADLLGDRAMRRLAERRKAQELALVDAADATAVVSEAELAVLKAERPKARVHLLSNIHAVPGSTAPFEARRDILFIGAFAHPPNADAVRWLAGEILPRVWTSLPGLHCHVIGADPPHDLRALGGPGLTIHGHVPDVEPFFARCRVSVAPLRYGSGVKGKINQSLAHGLPVVATSQAAEGMYLVDGESVLIADAPADFAAAVVRLHTDPSLWERLCAGGVAAMQTHFSFDAARRALAEVVG